MGPLPQDFALGTPDIFPKNTVDIRPVLSRLVNASLRLSSVLAYEELTRPRLCTKRS